VCEASTFRDLYQLFGLLKSVDRVKSCDDCLDCMMVEAAGSTMAGLSG
jgi:hypothetical protein